uniref:Helicase ATP-binding domain-containing protein n=1 Tax=viral metagenome TaxID=1070528 RepID=A0A6C0EDX7_9ZZZZ
MGEKKKIYRKTTEGEYEREQVVDKITNMNNTLLIIDEAHNISGNEYGEALHKIIKNSENLRIILLTATPMINLADEIVDLLNFIRPDDDQIYRDKIFTNDKNYLMKIKPTGLEYLKEKAQGYISFYRGSIPYTFAKRVEIGKIPKNLLFTPVIKCYMEDFQFDTYLETTLDFDDTLDKSSSAASNFVFPRIDKNKLKGCYSTEGINTVISQLNSDGPKLRSLINKNLFDNKLTKQEEDNFIFENNKKNISGLILKLDYIKKFSTKFYTIINNLNQLFDNNAAKMSSTAFIYSNLVKAGGIELLAEALIQNGYLEYQDDYTNYDIKDETLDYKTGLTYLQFKNKKMLNFKPATFLLITGNKEDHEDLSEVKQKIIQEVFNNSNNIDGKYIKFILGSRVMNEGVTLKNCKEVHILDVFYNIPKAEQVIGRAIRMCVHQDVINNNYKYPYVNVYRYVVAIDDRKKNELSTDELLYQKAEIKYLTIKDIEHSLKEIAIDCPLLLHANMFPEELEEYKNCVRPSLENLKNNEKICPALCDFRECNLKCDSKDLNNNYWDSKKMTYKKLDKSEINYNTFNDDLAKSEIVLIKNKIKDLYRFKHVYLYNEIMDLIKRSFSDDQAELFEEYFLEQALVDMMPINENDFNNYADTLYDKYNRPGYLILRDIYYIFQPFNENEDVSMYYRQFLDINQINQISIDNYIRQNYKDVEKKNSQNTVENNANIDNSYNFIDTLEYYENRDENFIVGIIDKNLNKLASNEDDLFKIRPPRAKILNKKRGTGIPTFKGAVCSTSKDKTYLINLIKKLPNVSPKDIDEVKKMNKEQICNKVKEKLLYLEKYSTSKEKNKMTYIMISKDHPIYEFPYNLEDRIKVNIKNINKYIDADIDILVTKIKNNDHELSYELSFKNTKNLESKSNLIKDFDFKLVNNTWIKIIN